KKKHQAEGVLYWDDGESVVESFATHNFYHWSFKYTTSTTGGRLTIKTERQAKFLAVPTLDLIEIFHYKYFANFTSFKLDGKKIDVDLKTSYHDNTKDILYISAKKLIDLSKGGTRNFSWSHSDKKVESPNERSSESPTESTESPYERGSEGNGKRNRTKVHVVEEKSWKVKIDVYP
ncbi:hypothetical protein COOONC_02796, partial [Cooperia oncophora]